MRTAWNIIKTTVSDFIDDSAMMHAAALAYYAIFSLGPILIIIVAVAGTVYGPQAVRGELEHQLSDTMGQAAATQIQEMIKNAQQTPGGRFATIFSIVVLLVAATGVFGQLQATLNTIWEVQPKSGRGAWGYVMSRILAFGIVVLMAVLILALITASTAVAAAGGWIEQWISLPVWATQAAEAIVSLGILTVLFAMIFKYLPDVKIRWRDVFMGAFVTALLFAIGKIGLGWYLGRGSTTSVYGAAGSIVVILLFVYYSSLIFLFGAEFTQVYARRFGKEIQPADYAEPVPAEQKPQTSKTKRQRSPSLAMHGTPTPDPQVWYDPGAGEDSVSDYARIRRAQLAAASGSTQPQRSVWQQIKRGLIRGFTERRPVTSCRPR